MAMRAMSSWEGAGDSGTRVGVQPVAAAYPQGSRPGGLIPGLSSGSPVGMGTVVPNPPRWLSHGGLGPADRRAALSGRRRGPPGAASPRPWPCVRCRRGKGRVTPEHALGFSLLPRPTPREVGLAASSLGFHPDPRWGWEQSSPTLRGGCHMATWGRRPAAGPGRRRALPRPSGAILCVAHNVSAD